MYNDLMRNQLAENESCHVDYDAPPLARFSCQLLNGNGQVTSARVYAESMQEAESLLRAANYRFENLSPSLSPVHPAQEKGIF